MPGRNWCDMSNKQIYSSLSYNMYIDIFSYKHQETSDYDQCIKSIFKKNLQENVSDFSGLINSLSSCHVNTKDVRM